jgi:TRAP-type C4-dicarboxylate transport system permease small subunit
MWAGLLGAAALFGAYEELYVAAPYNFLSQSVIAVSSLLVPVAMGFLVGIVTSSMWGEDASDGAGWTDPQPHSATAGLGIMADKETNAS